MYILCSKTAKHVGHSVLKERNFDLKINIAYSEYDLSKWVACAESVFCLSYVIDYLVTSLSLIFVITIRVWLKRGLCRTTLRRGTMLVNLNNKGNTWIVYVLPSVSTVAFCHFVFLFGRVVDEVEALKAILMDELIVRTNERLVSYLLAARVGFYLQSITSAVETLTCTDWRFLSKVVY